MVLNCATHHIYRKCITDVKHRISKETKKIAESLDSYNKAGCYASRLVFITIKNHKPNFQNNTKCRLNLILQKTN